MVKMDVFAMLGIAQKCYISNNLTLVKKWFNTHFS